MSSIISIDGRDVPLTVRANARSRRMSLRVDMGGDGLVVVTPPHVPEAAIVDFIRRKQSWVSGQLARLPARVVFQDGSLLPLAGRLHTIRHAPQARRGVWVEDGSIWVSGDAAHLERRLTDWLRRQARDALSERAHVHARVLGVRVGRVTIRDTRSRWGSCSASGDLSFCWRLILAPEWVVDYVAAHEVAHLLEFNHSPRFWALVARLIGDTVPARRWLKDNGLALHRYG